MYPDSREVHIVTAKDSEDRMTILQVHLDKGKAEELVEALKANDSNTGGYTTYEIVSKGIVY